MIEALLSLSRTAWLIGLLNDSAGEMFYPLVPLYLAGAAGRHPAGMR